MSCEEDESETTDEPQAESQADVREGIIKLAQLGHRVEVFRKAVACMESLNIVRDTARELQAEIDERRRVGNSSRLRELLIGVDGLGMGVEADLVG